jgi:hypothetical protein
MAFIISFLFVNVEGVAKKINEWGLEWGYNPIALQLP